MAKGHPPSGASGGGGETPKDFPQTPPPPDLYATSDIRFVMLEIGKLTTKVDRLITDVESHNGKIDALRHQATFIKGGIAVATIVIGIVAWIFNTKWDAILQALDAIQKIKGG